MGGGEVKRDSFPGAMTDEGANPRRLRGRGATDPQSRTDRFDGERGVVVQIPVAGLLGLSGPKIEVRLVPHFEIPLRNLINAVAVDQMLQ